MEELFEDKSYEKILDIIIELREVRDHFHTHSAGDIKRLIHSKINSVREPGSLQKLYKLEEMIRSLREGLEVTKQMSQRR